jgi:hypothetical protein
VRFYFPDSQDQVDPGFDFALEERTAQRVRQRDDLYAHEALVAAPFDGLLVSKTIVDGSAHGAGKYTMAQRNRLYRVGVREFFRLDTSGRELETMGDCGAFSYVQAEQPPYTPDDVIDFYSECGFDAGLSVDHVILAYSPDSNHPELPRWEARQTLTLDLAAQFWQRCKTRRVRFQPMGVAQGWSPQSYAAAVVALQRMGYRRIALGGMVPLRTPDILSCLRGVAEVRRLDVEFHLLGITRCDHIGTFESMGVSSFDSTSPFRQSFKDDRDNYYVLDGAFTAIRIPQVDGHPTLRRRILAGEVSQKDALDLERRCLRALRSYDSGRGRLNTLLRTLREYAALNNMPDNSEAYGRTLDARPWRLCGCGICETIGVEVIVFRGAERNKRRGFHNLFVFNQRLQRQLAQGQAL